MLLPSCTWVDDVHVPETLQEADIMKYIYALSRSTAGVKKITPLKGGLSGLSIYKIDMDNKSYVVRLLAKRSIADRVREIQAQTIASQQGWGPKVYVSNEEQGWIIMEYLKPETVTFLSRIGTALYKKLGYCLRMVHNGPSFLEGKTALAEIDELLELCHEHKKIPFYFNYDDLKQIVTFIHNNHCPTFVPCHRDLNPNNIIFSKNKVFLIDFEYATQDDPFYDLATVGIYYIFDSFHEKIFLEAYFGKEPTQQECAYYQLMKQAVLLFYGLDLLKGVPVEVISTASLTIQPLLLLFKKIDEGLLSIEKPADQLKIATSMIQEALNMYRHHYYSINAYT